MVYVLHIGIRGTSINVLSPCKHFQRFDGRTEVFFGRIASITKLEKNQPSKPADGTSPDKYSTPKSKIKL